MNISKKSRLHFIGIGGVSMSGLSKYCLKEGYTVSGSDRADSEILKELRKLGAQIYIGHDEKNIKRGDVVIYSSAIKSDNEELASALNNGNIVIKRSVLLNEILSDFNNKIAVSGCHGKTTTTAMLTHVLKTAKVGITSFIGGKDCELSNYYSDGKNVAVTEACEYLRNFLDLQAEIKVVLNIDRDHMDCYLDIDDLIKTYSEFIENSTAFINADDVNAKKIINKKTITFAIEKKADYRAVDVSEKNCRYYFSVIYKGKKSARISVFGKHNIYNALSVFAVSDYLGIEEKTIIKSITAFKGVERRFELINEVERPKIYADYSHHPKELESAIITAKKVSKKDWLIVFQPHTYSRTEKLMDDFTEVLKDETTVIYKTYAAREKYSAKGSAERLYKNLKKLGSVTEYADTTKNVIKIIKNAVMSGKNVLILGAGDLYDNIKEQIKF